MAVIIDGTNGITTPGEVNTANGSVAGNLTVTGALQSSGVATNLYPLVSGTAVSASGTAVDFTGIPSWVRRITVMIAGLSTNGTSLPQIQLGDAGDVETSGYTGSVTQTVTSVSGSNLSAGILLQQASWTAAATTGGQVIISLLSAASNTWTFSSAMGKSDSILTTAANGYKALSGTLDRVRITTVNGTDTFDAGTINILYE